jgi:hypothetical protein
MALYHSPEQINAMTQSWWTYSNPQPPVAQNEGQVARPARKALAAEWLSNHRQLANDPGWWGWEGSRLVLFCDLHARYLPATSVLPANDGLPDFNLTRDGSAGADVP